MKIIATFANRVHDPEIVELVCAWDEYSVDANYEGWQEDRRHQLDSWDDDLLRSVDVEIEVNMSKIYEVLIPEIRIGADSVEVLDGVDGE